jgi:hypothetical protein
MPSYEKKAQSVMRRIAAKGRAVTMVKKNRSAADPNMPWKGSGLLSDTQVTATALFGDPVSEKDLGRELRRGDEENTDNITRGLQVCFISVAENPTYDFTTFDRVIDNGLVYTVDEMHVLRPGGVALMYEIYMVR